MSSNSSRSSKTSSPTTAAEVSSSRVHPGGRPMSDQANKTTKMSSTRLPARSSSLAILVIFGLMLVTLYMAFAFPYTLLHLKQTDTSQVRSLIIVGREGEKSPSPEGYFAGEEADERLHEFGYNQLTNTGKERMYLLGKFLRLRYNHLLPSGNPRSILARSAHTDRCIESAQSLLAGLNPAQSGWLWSSTGELGGWQPKAVHTTATAYDDLLAPEPNCFRLLETKYKWKNSTRYQQLVNEFRHDLQTLRSNTKLDFEDDLEALENIEDALSARRAYGDQLPAWYTSTFASRLAHIADVSTGSRFDSPEAQRFFVGRLLHEIARNIDARILSDQLQFQQQVSRAGHLEVASASAADKSPGGRQASAKRLGQPEPNVYLYVTDKKRLSALLSSLQIYSSQPLFGSLLLIELHYDPADQQHFLRLFTVSSSSPNVFPEPLRVNPIACGDTMECSPGRFEQNVRHLMLDPNSWRDTCLNYDGHLATTLPPAPAPQPVTNQDYLSVGPQTTSTLAPSPVEPATQSLLDELDQKLIVGPTNIRPLEPSADLKPTTQAEAVEMDSSTGKQQATTLTLAQTDAPAAMSSATFLGVQSTTPASPPTSLSPAEQTTKNKLNPSESTTSIASAVPETIATLASTTTSSPADPANTESAKSAGALQLTRDIYYPRDDPLTSDYD